MSTEKFSNEELSQLIGGGECFLHSHTVDQIAGLNQDPTQVQVILDTATLMPGSLSVVEAAVTVNLPAFPIPGDTCVVTAWGFAVDVASDFNIANAPGPLSLSSGDVKTFVFIDSTHGWVAY